MQTTSNRPRAKRSHWMAATIGALALSGAAYIGGLWSAPASGSSNPKQPTHSVTSDVCRPTVPAHLC